MILLLGGGLGVGGVEWGKQDNSQLALQPGHWPLPTFSWPGTRPHLSGAQPLFFQPENGFHNRDHP